MYEEEAGLHFMFGGNPGGTENRNGKLRLGDFWRLELQRQQNKDLERVLVMEIRKTQFREKSSDPMTALAFLQTEVSSCVDHEDKEEQRELNSFSRGAKNRIPSRERAFYSLQDCLLHGAVTVEGLTRVLSRVQDAAL